MQCFFWSANDQRVVLLRLGAVWFAVCSNAASAAGRSGYTDLSADQVAQAACNAVGGQSSSGGGSAGLGEKLLATLLHPYRCKACTAPGPMRVDACVGGKDPKLPAHALSRPTTHSVYTGQPKWDLCYGKTEYLTHAAGSFIAASRNFWCCPSMRLTPQSHSHTKPDVKTDGAGAIDATPTSLAGGAGGATPTSLLGGAGGATPTSSPLGSAGGATPTSSLGASGGGL